MMLLDYSRSYKSPSSILISPITILYCILFHSIILNNQAKYSNTKPSPYSIRSIFYII